MSTRTKKILISTAIAAAALVLLEGLCSFYLAWAQGRQRITVRENVHCEYDPELGWINLPNAKAPHIYGRGIHLTTNSQRFRGTRDYAERVPDGTYRVVCLGDSFTMGYGVGNGDTYAALLEHASPTVETINMGLGGFGLGQCYLWYKRDGVAFETDCLVLAVIAGDFYRMTAVGNVANVPKPLLDLEDGKVVATNLPVADATQGLTFGQVAKRCMKLSSLNKMLVRLAPSRRNQSKLTQELGEQPFIPVAEAVLTELRDLSRERGQRFVVLYLPAHRELIGGNSELIHQWLAPFLERAEIPLVNLLPDFLTLTPSQRATHFLADGHYTVLGNQIVADRLTEEIRRLDPEFPR